MFVWCKTGSGRVMLESELLKFTILTRIYRLENSLKLIEGEQKEIKGSVKFDKKKFSKNWQSDTFSTSKFLSIDLIRDYAEKAKNPASHVDASNFHDPERDKM